MWNYDRFRDIQISSDEEDSPPPVPAMHSVNFDVDAMMKQANIMREKREAKFGQTIEAIKSNTIQPLNARVLEDLLYEDYIFGSGNAIPDMLSTYQFVKNLGNFPIEGTFQDACFIDDFAWLLERIYRKSKQLTRVTPPIWTKLQQNARDPDHFTFVYLDCYGTSEEKQAERLFEYHCGQIWKILSVLGERARHETWRFLCILPTPIDVDDQPKKPLEFKKIATPVKFETHLTRYSELHAFGTMPAITTEKSIEMNLKRWYYQPHSEIEIEAIRKTYAEGKISEPMWPYVINSGLVPIPNLKYQPLHSRTDRVAPNWSFEIKTAWLDSKGIEWDKSKENLMFKSSVDEALEKYAQEGESPPFVWWPNKYPTRRDLVGNAFYFEGLKRAFRENGAFSHYTTLYGS